MKGENRALKAAQSAHAVDVSAEPTPIQPAIVGDKPLTKPGALGGLPRRVDPAMQIGLFIKKARAYTWMHGRSREYRKRALFKYVHAVC